MRLYFPWFTVLSILSMIGLLIAEIVVNGGFQPIGIGMFTYKEIQNQKDEHGICYNRDICYIAYIHTYNKHASHTYIHIYMHCRTQYTHVHIIM